MHVFGISIAISQSLVGTLRVPQTGRLSNSKQSRSYEYHGLTNFRPLLFSFIMMAFQIGQAFGQGPG